MAVIIALAVMTGLQQELRDRILGSQPHIYVSRTGGIADYQAEAAQRRQDPARHRRGARPSSGRALITASAGPRQFISERHRSAAEPRSSDVGAVASERQPRRAGAADRGRARTGSCSARICASKLRCHCRRSVIADAGTTLSPMGMIPAGSKLRVAGVFTPRAHTNSGSRRYGFVSARRRQTRMLSKDQARLASAARRRHPSDAASPVRYRSTAGATSHFTQDWAEMNWSRCFPQR